MQDKNKGNVYKTNKEQERQKKKKKQTYKEQIGKYNKTKHTKMET